MRLNVDVAQLTSITPSYHTFRIAKRSGAPRHRGPDDAHKHMQRLLLRRVLSGLKVRP
jgi:hypothetical protein